MFWHTATCRTEWFERIAQRLASDAGLYCQNKAAKPTGEWLNIDHIMVVSNVYESFPEIAIEHENMSLSRKPKLGKLPVGDATNVPMEWALWKLLAVHSKLAVLVAYPMKAHRPEVLSTIAQLVHARAAYPCPPELLILLAWRETDAEVLKRGTTPPAARSIWRPREQYEAFVASNGGPPAPLLSNATNQLAG
jgi:hypothetical protein